MSDIKNCALVFLIGGKGLRSGLSVKKQYYEAMGLPVFIHSLRAVSVFPFKQLVVVVPSEDEGYVKRILKENRFSTTIALGGENRVLSVYNGLKEVEEMCEYVFIHDGVRPFAREEDLNNLYLSVVQHEAAILCSKTTDTLKEVVSGVVVSTPKRENMFNAITPQAFLKEKYLQAIERYIKEKGDWATDDASIYSKYVGEVFTVVSSFGNMKITTAGDVEYFEYLLRKEKCE